MQAVEWPADNRDKRATAALVPDARNARKHSADQVKHLAALITAYGWTMPVLIDEQDRIIAGHGRVMAAQQIGLREVPVIVARGWDEAKRRAYMLADNRIAEMSSWDTDMLQAELPDLAALGIDLPSIGFDLPKIEPPKPPRIEDAPLSASFWIAVEGPLVQQAAALHALKALAALPGVTLHSDLRERA